MNKLIERLITLYQGNPRVAILMSGKGSNAEAILKETNRYPNLKFVALCTDQTKSRALELSQAYQLEYFCLEGEVKTQENRHDYFMKLAEYLNAQSIDTLIYAGFMKISPAFFVKQFPGINVHPADLTICDSTGKPKYTGMNVIADAIRDNHSYIASSAHVVDSEVDCGQVIMVSNKLVLQDDDKDIHGLHEKLKTHCEHRLYPFVLELLSQGRIRSNNLPYQFNETFYFSDELMKKNQSLDPLSTAYIAQTYCSQGGFDFDHIDQVFDKVKEEYDELKHAYHQRDQDHDHFIEELGDCFFALVNLCRFANVHPNDVVRNSNKKYLKRCEYIESELSKSRRGWLEINRDEIDDLWKKAKEYAKNSN